jgi:hypothetical protein
VVVAQNLTQGFEAKQVPVSWVVSGIVWQNLADLPTRAQEDTMTQRQDKPNGALEQEQTLCIRLTDEVRLEFPDTWANSLAG